MTRRPDVARKRLALARLALAALGGAVLLLAGCATITYDAVTVEGIVAMNRVAPPDSYEKIGEIEVEQRTIFAIAELITVRDAQVEEAVRRELARTGGDAVLNLRIEEEYDVIDVLVALVGQGLVDTRQVEIRGDVVRWREGGSLDEAREAFLVESCRPIRVEAQAAPAGAAAARTAHLCAGASATFRVPDPR